MIGLKMVFNTMNTINGLNRKKYYYYVHLSKNMAYALRHKPVECGLELDKQGYASTEALLAYLTTLKGWHATTYQDISDCIRIIPKKRFELKGNQIRAYYGHSCQQEIIKTEALPPEILYHGTSQLAANSIMKEGITPQNRQYVHLSSDIDTAHNVGQRKDNNPVILCIDASKAHRDGIKFYIGNQATWLSKYISPKYISILQK